MSKKGGSRHMKRIASPKYMKLNRKIAKYVAKPNPGRHTLNTSMALSTFIKDKLELAHNSKETERMVNGRMIQVNGKVVTELKYPIGFGDTVDIIPNNESYTVTIGKHGVFEARKNEGKNQRKTLKVVGRYVAKGGRLMMRLNNGNTMNVYKDAGINDSVVLENNKIVDVIKLREGAKCMVLSGLHAQETGTIKEITKGTAMRNATVRVEGKTGVFETLFENVIAVGA